MILMADFHNILFNMIILYSLALGVYGVILAVREQPLSGNFWGAVGTFALLCGITLIIGVIIALQGGTVAADGRNTVYFLYMLFLVIIMPGLFSMLRGRDDRNAALAFALLAFFNASVAFSMWQRGLVTWILTSS
jgi:hypothetical protein